MAFYSYQCEKCKKVIDKEYKMNDDKPKSIKCECKGKMLRVWNNVSIKVPEFFNNDVTDNYKFDKRPSQRKQFY